MPTKVIAFLLVCLIPIPLWAWGTGHDQVNELAVEMLQGNVPTESAANIVKWSHTPDDFTRWENLKHFRVSAADLQLLKAHKLETAYSSHSAEGQAVEFILLVRAFKDNDPQRIAFWSACLLHSLADEAACNHDPLVHYITYALKGGYHLKTGPGVGLDFSEVAATPEGKEMVRRLAMKEVPRATPRDADAAVLDVMLSGLESNAYMTRRGATIARSYLLNPSKEDMTAARIALAELGVHGAARGRDVILAAKELARRGATPKLTPEIEAEFRKQRAERVAARPLADDSIYSELLERQAPAGQRAIGVLVEASVAMNAARFSFGAKYVTAAAARTMQLGNVPFRLVDVRSLAQKAALDPRTTPVLIVCAGPFHVDDPGKETLKSYCAGGGRLLWIGGEPSPLLGKLAENLVVADPATLPVSDKYGQDTPVAQTARFDFVGPFQAAVGGGPFRMVHNPNTSAGWQTPRCRYRLKGGEGVVVLVEMRTPTSSLSLAGAWMGQDGKALAIFMPEYLMAPYVLSDEELVADISRPTLDKVGRRILSASLSLLGQDIGSLK